MTGGLAHGHGLTRQQRFISLQILTLQEHRIRRDPIPSASTMRSPRTTSRPAIRWRRAIADHQRARTGEVAQRSRTRSVRVSCMTVIKMDIVTK